MWGVTLTILTIAWILLTGISLWWLTHTEEGWKRLAWALLVLLLPGLGAVIWWTWGTESDFPVPERWKVSTTDPEVESEEAL